MPRPPLKRNGFYPNTSQNNTIKLTKTAICIKNSKSFLLVSQETNRTINIYLGGPEKWCVHCELIKDENNELKEIGYLVKLRYDMLCSLEHNFARGQDTKQLLYFLIQYIHNTYPTVNVLQFNDLSTRKCDNMTEVNLAVMTYLYTEKTWYEKNFGSYISPQSQQEYDRIKTQYNKSKEIPWETMKYTIQNYDNITKMNDSEMERLYNDTNNWKNFFEQIYNKIEIGDFCVFISSWLNSFILKYFNNLQGLSFFMPIKDYKINYSESKYMRGGRRFTRRITRKHSDACE